LLTRLGEVLIVKGKAVGTSGTDEIGLNQTIGQAEVGIPPWAGQRRAGTALKLDQKGHAHGVVVDLGIHLAHEILRAVEVEVFRVSDGHADISIRCGGDGT